MLERFFRLSENQTSTRVELLAGLTTFLTMAYIIFVQPSVLSGAMFGKPTGMDFGAVTAATCVSAALATVLMALYARYPIGQAPGMGENFFFVFSAVPAAAAAGFDNAWQVALGVVFISGVLFLILSLAGLRELVFNAVSPSLKNGIAAGIGLFIAFIGLQNAGLILKDPGTAVKMNAHFASPDLIVFFAGLLLTAVLHVRRVPGSILWGIVGATALAAVFKLGLPHLPRSIATAPDVTGSVLMQRFEFAKGIVAAPPSLAPTFLKMDLAGALTPKMLPFIFVFLFMLVFDAIGTLIGVCEQAGFIKDNKLPRAKQAMLSDAVGTVAGAALGTSTVTSFIESAAGVEQGGRTGLTGLVVGALFLLSLFFSPVIAMVGSYPPITAPALVIVGAMMIQNVAKVDWKDYSESVPAFLTMIGIPLSYSIADGLALGFISYPIIKLFSGKGREIGWLTYALAAALVAYFLFVRSRI
ncbi:MAG TPA: NCS2 family permease [Candidatus Paceibacterota bacterium]|nr:NCS2 family permease [Verrucomicrobiota bacterium]HSA12323.1 NCS2 family permease [Candidatus Paceibacterota bacterium]